MAFILRPIRIKRPIANVNRRKVQREMTKAGAGFTNVLSIYPPQRTPRKRSGDLGRGWTLVPAHLEGTSLVAGTGTKVEYAGFVQGYKRRRPRQLKLFRRYGWQSAEDVGKRVWKERRPQVLAALQGR